jgi:hypothetical protein
VNSVLFVYLLALIGLLTLLGLSAAAILGADRGIGEREPADAFDVALAAVARLQSSAWRAVQELRDLDSQQNASQH